jgi:hypothetical protein
MSRLVFLAPYALLAGSLLVARASAQTPPAAPPPSSQRYEGQVDPAPVAAPAPSPVAPEPATTAVPADPVTAPQPAPDPAPPPVYQPPPPPPPSQRYEGQIGPGGGYAEPSSGGDDNGEGGGGEPFEMPPFSVRLDPFNWLLQGRLPLELEVGIWKLLSIELVPEFVTSEDPPLRDFSSYEDGATQHSNGLGPLSGASLALGVWLDGEPFEGYVIRAILTNYGYEYKSSVDSVTRTTRRFGVFFGSYRRWSFFTIGGGIGLSYELHQQERCGLRAQTTSDGTRITADPDAECDGELQVALDREADAADDTNGFLHPFYLDARFSVGFIID